MRCVGIIKPAAVKSCTCAEHWVQGVAQSLVEEDSSITPYLKCLCVAPDVNWYQQPVYILSSIRCFLFTSFSLRASPFPLHFNTKKIYPIFFHFSLLYNIFVSAKTNHLNLLMKPDPRALKASLLRRELELQRLIRQMKFDQLHNSPVYKNLEKELVTVKAQLNLTES